MRKSDTEKTEKVGEIVYRYSSDWIHTLETENHWRLYWQQQRLMQNHISAGQHILEIGVGSGFTANYLRSKGVKVTTIDIDKDKNPDIVANVVTFDWSSYSFDHILAFEVFEHIPFTEFEKFLALFNQICTGYFFCSVPISEYVLLRLEARIPKLGNRELKLSLPKKKLSTDHHFWEIGSNNITISYLEFVFKKNNLNIVNKMKKLSRLYFSATTMMK